MAVEFSNGRVRGRIWRFGPCEYDELERQLWVQGKLADLTDKPLEVLVALLRAPERMLKKEELLNLAWGSSDDDLKGTEEALTKAISQLRQALPEEYRRTIIRTVRGVGYELGVTVASRTVDRTVEPELRLNEGIFVPGKGEWKLIRALDAVTPHRVWLAELPATRQTRVFKFAEDGVRLLALQKEITLSRFFDKALSDSSSFVKVHYWRLTTKPYLLEAEYGGMNLAEWAQVQRSTVGLSRGDLLNIVADLAEAVATAHGLGVLHNDLKPSNILISPKSGTEPGWKVKVCDFGIASLAEPERLEELDISNHGFSDAEAGVPGGSVLYRAPEVRPGQPSTVAADIYAIGVILFQLLCGDFRQTPAPGWQNQIDDAILRQDIEATVNLDPALRLKSAAELATRLRTLDSRRREQREFDQKQADAAEAVARYQTLQARLPWIWTAVAGLGVGLALSLFFYARAAEARNRAVAAAAHAEKLTKFDQQMFDFVDSDSAPAHTITAEGMIDRSVPLVDAIKDDPQTQTELYNFLGSDYADLGAYDKADAVLGRGLKLDEQIYGEDSVQTAKTLVILSQLRGNQGQTQISEQMAEKAYAIDSQRLKPDDRFRLEAEEALAEARYGLNKNDQAVAIEESLVNRIKGENNLDLLSYAFNTLALAEYSLGNDQKALEANEQSLEIDKKRLGDSNPNIAGHLMTIAAIQSKRGDYSAAIETYRRAVEIDSRWFGPKHPQTADAQIALGETMEAAGNAREALPLLEAALPVEKTLWSDETVPVARAYDALGRTENALGAC